MIVRYLGESYIKEKAGGREVSRREIATEAEWRTALKEEFGIQL